MNNYLTTIGGLLAAIGLALTATPLPPGWAIAPPIIAAIGTAIVGFTAKDFNSHSTSDEVKQATKDEKDAK